ncbi:PBSX family phage terminase large subunit [Lentilactobacillus sp. SPB1-3]|uniref:PBSX family phage terminase large subunit n=1 Tax=Lentilactobacillus terminaliae TaxID=3003483 RepID=A0ACD5DCX0_9LACO|nr:PBSX family phage terminase large subunit [Lentilactobacillus sp. SPB1-3]MCZ0978029.1 PBSX family phage terminase large subunit [Lentilactobacillus sp. SPB1-3]
MTVQFEYTPFSPKQLQVLSWWIDPRAYEGDFDKNIAEHPEWLNRTDYDALICDGSVRAGKTLIMSMSYILWSMTNYQEETFGIAGKTIGSLRRNVIKPLKRMLESRHYVVKDKRADNLLEISYGSNTNYYYLFGGKDESSQDLVQGITVAGFFFDEVALMPQSFVNQATARASVDGSKFWFNCNPASPYHWFKTEWLDKLSEHRAMHIHFMMTDNPSLSDSVKRRYETQYSGVFYQRYILGQWVLSDGVVYDNFDRETMVVDAPALSHITKYFVSCDYGAMNPTVFLLWGFSSGVWYCLKEYYYDGRHDSSGRQKSDEEYANDLVAFLGNLKPTVILDPSAVHFAVVLQEHGFNVLPGNNDVINGIRLTQNLMNSGEIKFTPFLSNLFKELGSYVWDDKASQRGEDRVVKDHDHCLTGDTLVDTVDGQKMIKDLVGKSGEVYCVDYESQPTTGHFDQVRKTRTDAEIYELELEDGSTIKATIDHPVLTKAGWKPLGELTSKDEVIYIG